MEITSTMIRDRVAFGVEMLDDMHGSWEENIFPAEVDMSIKGKCILSHLYGDYETATNQMGLEEIPAVTAGFYEDEPRILAMLTDAWREVLYDRV